MNDQNKNQKKPEAKHEAPGVPYPLSSRLRPSYFGISPIDHRLSMRPASWIAPSLLPPPGKHDGYFSLEETSREHGPSQLAPLTPSSRKRKIDSISTSSPPSSPEASRAAPPKHSTLVKPEERSPISVSEEEECTARLAALRDLFGPDHSMFRHEPERERSPSLISTDESDSDYIDPDSESESESSQDQERKSSPSPSCTDESDSDYSVPDTESEPEPSQEQGRVPWHGVSAEMLHTMTETEEDLYRPPIPSLNDLGPRDDDKLFGDLFGLVPASSLGHPPPSPQNPATPPQEQEKNRSPGPIDDDSLSTLSKVIDKALEKHYREDLASAEPSLSQDLEKKMLSSLSAYDLNIEKLGQEIRDRCDRICERFDRLEKEKRDRRNNAIPGTYQGTAEIMFPGQSICELTVHERQMVRLERRRRLEKGYLEQFGNRGKAIAEPSREQEKKASQGPSGHDLTFHERQTVRLAHCRRYERMHRERLGCSGNAIAGPSREREQMMSPSLNLDEMIRQDREKLQALDRPVAAWRPSSDPATRLPSPDQDDTVSQIPETSEQQSREGIDALVATPCQKPEKKARVFDDDLSEMIDQQRRFEERKKKRSPSSNPNDAVDMSEKEAREETDATISEPSQEAETKTSPDNDTAMELEKDLGESQDSLLASPSSSQGQKRKRSSASDHEKSFFEHFEQMRKHVRESVEQEKKRRKKSADRSFEECMNELYPADSEIWKIDDEPLRVRPSKPIESRSDNDLGNGSLPISDEYLSNEKDIRRWEESINDVSKGSAPFAGMAPLPTILSPMPPMPLFPPMPNISNMPPWLAMDIAPPMLAMSNMLPNTPIPPMPPLFAMDIFPNTPAMPYESIAAYVPGSYLITLPPNPNPPLVYDLHAHNLGTSHGHTPWNPETETLEAVSNRPFTMWIDIKGVRNEMYGYLRRAGLSPVSIEACRVKGEQNVRLMVFIPMKDWPRSASDKLMQEAIDALAKVLEDLGINDVDVELWETDFSLVVV